MSSGTAAAPERPRMRLAVHTAVAAEELRSGRVTIEQFLQQAAALGCRGVEIDPEWTHDAAATRDVAERAGCTVVYGSGVRYPSGRGDSEPAVTALATAGALGAKRMRVLPPNGEPQWTFLEQAKEAGVQLLLANESLPGSVVRVRALVDAAATPWIQASLDTAAPVLVGEDPVRSAYLLNRRIAHVHVTDVKSLLGRQRTTYPGDGTLWWYGLLWALGALGYCQDLTISFQGEGRGVELLPLAVDHLTRVYAARFAHPVPWVAAGHRLNADLAT